MSRIALASLIGVVGVVGVVEKVLLSAVSSSYMSRRALASFIGGQLELAHMIIRLHNL